MADHPTFRLFAGQVDTPILNRLQVLLMIYSIYYFYYKGKQNMQLYSLLMQFANKFKYVVPYIAYYTESTFSSKRVSATIPLM